MKYYRLFASMYAGTILGIFGRFVDEPILKIEVLLAPIGLIIYNMIIISIPIHIIIELVLKKIFKTTLLHNNRLSKFIEKFADSKIVYLTKKVNEQELYMFYKFYLIFCTKLEKDVIRQEKNRMYEEYMILKLSGVE